MLNDSVLHIAPLLISLFFILGVFVFYEILFDGIRLFLSKREINIPSNKLRPWLGVIYLFIILISFQMIISQAQTNWLFINFQITALVFCAILLNVPVKYHIFIPIVLIFMIFNSAIYYWESWCFALGIIGFYCSLKYIKNKRLGHYPFIYYTIDILLFGFIFWTLAKIKFSLNSILVLKQLTYLVFFAIFALGYIGLMIRNKKVKGSLFYLASHDELTDSNNYALFNSDLKNYFSDAIEKKVPLSMMMFDIDYFKKVNDTYGHSAGNQVLKYVVVTTQNVINTRDKNIKLYRTGGEEFNILFPNYTLQQSHDAIQKIFSEVNQLVVPYKSHELKITISAGATQLKIDDLNPKAFYDRADSALYESKNKGRCRITIK